MYLKINTEKIYYGLQQYLTVTERFPAGILRRGAVGIRLGKCVR